MRTSLDSTLAAQMASQGWAVAIFVLLTFTTGTQYVWSGIGPFVWNGNTYTGVGSLGQLGDVTEGVEWNASGTSVSVSGIDVALLADSQAEIQQGLPAKVWIGAMNNGVLVGNPYLRFTGVIDKSSITIDPSGDKPTASIELSLETRAMNHSRASNRRYTKTDQNANGHADDSGFDGVEQLNDIALRWG